MSGENNAQNMKDAFAYADDLRAKLLAAIGDLSQKQADFQYADDQWSIGEVLDHLTLSGTGTFAQVKSMCDGTAEKAELVGRGADDKFLAGVADVEKTGKAPAGKNILPTAGKPAPGILTAFENVFTKAKEELAAYENDDLAQYKAPFATFVDLDGYQWIKFAGAHEARHIQQVERIKASSDYPA